jgi:hypothetical protein
MCFDNQPVTLSGASTTLSGTQLPEWVSQAGKAIFGQAATLVQPQFDEEGNYIPDAGYQGERMAQYVNTAYDYDGDGQITEADATAATAAGDTGKASDITQGLASGLGFPKSKLSLEEQEAGRILTEGANQYQGYLTGFDTDGDGIADTQSSQTFMDQIGQGYLGTRLDPDTGKQVPRTYQDLYGDMMGEDFAIGKGTQAQEFLDIYSAAMDPAIKDIQEQTLAQQNAARAAAARGGAFGGSRLGIQEAMLGSEGIQSQADLRARGLAEGLGFAAGRFDADRAGRIAADAAARGAYETEESGRLQAAQQYQNLATLTQGLQQQAAAGLISTGEAKRLLDQQALDLAYADYLDQSRKPYEDINFALGALQGVPYNTQQYGYNTQTQQQQGPSVYGQTLGALGTLGSAYYMGQR